MSGMLRSSDSNADGVGHALQLAADALRLTTATPDQLAAAAAFLAKARARFPEAVRDARKMTAIERLDQAGQAIRAGIRRREAGGNGWGVYPRPSNLR